MKNEKAFSCIKIIGAQENNLKNISLEIPRNTLIVFTGVSGSGKSSLAFDTLYAEAQRRYIDTFPSYVKQFIPSLNKPKVAVLEGLSPAIAIEQKTVQKTPRSTVGTITEIYDFLRILYARAADAFSPHTGEKMIQSSPAALFQKILDHYETQNIQLLAPVVKARKGQYLDLLGRLGQKGFSKVRIDGKFYNLGEKILLDRYQTHQIDLVIDRFKVQNTQKERLQNALDLALEWGEGSFVLIDENEKSHFFSIHLTCPTTGNAYPSPDPNTFSFNSPYGACPNCAGIGQVLDLDLAAVIRPFPLIFGGIPFFEQITNIDFYLKLEAFLSKYGFSSQHKANLFPLPLIEKILYGADETYTYTNQQRQNKTELRFVGVLEFLDQIQEKAEESGKKFEINPLFERFTNCPQCKGSRLQELAHYFKIAGKTIADLAQKNISDLLDFIKKLPDFLSPKQKEILAEVVEELQKRILFLDQIGLSYLHLNRNSGSLSGGEAQRIRLATQMGSQLTGVLYVLDEPSIGLHQADNQKLVLALQKLRDLGNTVLVVEHDQDMMLGADFIVDIGPLAGKKGGKILAALPKEDFLKSSTLTADYLKGKIQIPKSLERAGNGKKLSLLGAAGNNLKNIDVHFDLGKLIVISGVSGSGKSSLIKHTLYPILHNHFYKNLQKPLPYKAIKGLEHIDKIIEIDQSPIGRTPRSNIATYMGFFTDIRNLFARLPLSKIRAYSPGTFSFNIKGGRCENCKGSGVQTVEMGFMPNVYLTCPDCQGQRYLTRTRDVRYKNKNIADILELSVDEAIDFFIAHPFLVRKLETLQQVGLGYIQLGQSSTTFSGGEAQRMKLAAELSRKSTGNTLYILDEPTTGLHFQDVAFLMQVIQKLVNLGNTVIIIEHNLEVIKQADQLIDFGPGGGFLGGEIVAQGTPKEVARSKKSITGPFLRSMKL